MKEKKNEKKASEWTRKKRGIPNVCRPIRRDREGAAETSAALINLFNWMNAYKLANQFNF